MQVHSLIIAFVFHNLNSILCQVFKAIILCLTGLLWSCKIACVVPAWESLRQGFSRQGSNNEQTSLQKRQSLYTLLYTLYNRGIQMPTHHHPVRTKKPVKQPKHWLNITFILVHSHDYNISQSVTCQFCIFGNFTLLFLIATFWF